MTPDKPSDDAIVERILSLANEAVFTVALQRRRLRSGEPEDDEFVMRWWADAQFLIVMLRRLRRTAELGERVPAVQARVQSALREFDHVLPSLRTMRNVGEHVDAYALDKGKNNEISRRELQVGRWDGMTFYWLGSELNVDYAMTAAEDLLIALRSALRER